MDAQVHSLGRIDKRLNVFKAELLRKVIISQPNILRCIQRTSLIARTM